MANSLLQLPPEVLIGVFSTLSLVDLLSFSETSHYARFLTNANLHTLTLDFCSKPGTSRLRSYALARRIQSTKTILQPQRATQAALNISKYLSKSRGHDSTAQANNLHRASIEIPHGCIYDYPTLTDFQSALTSSVLTRYATGLRDLELTIWAFTVPIAKALANLTALQSLSITIANSPYIRAVPRSSILGHLREERKAWNILAGSQANYTRLKSLRIAGAGLDVTSLLGVLCGSSCRTLSLKKCDFIGKELWEVMRKTWVGWAKLESLCISECGGVLDESTLISLGAMENLKHLDLSGCIGLTCNQVQEWNNTIGCVPILTPPKIRGRYEEEIIEVDPAYMQSDD